MPYDGSTWDETNPTNSTPANELDDIAIDIKKGISGRLNKEHAWPASQASTASGGTHTYISFAPQTAAPSLPVVLGTTQNGALYTTSAGHSLIYKNSAGSAVTIVGGATDTGGITPPGITVPYAGTTSPAGWLMCDGSAVSRTTYGRLFNAIGTIWGTGDNTTTFNVPDIRGYAIVCKSTGGIFANVAAKTGELTHVLTIAEMPAHAHGYIAPSGGTLINTGGGGNAHSSNIALTSTATGGDGAHNNIQPSVVMNYIIKD